MENIESLLKKAHEFWRAGNELKAIDFLNLAIRECRNSDNKIKLIELLNEYGGALRVTGSYEKGIVALKEAVELCKLLGLKKTVSYATTLMNLANIYREASKYEEATFIFEEAKSLYSNLNIKDYSYIALLNNYSLLLKESKSYILARKYQEEAIQLLEKESKYIVPLAISYNNLYEILYKLDEFFLAKEYLKKAENILSKELGIKHPLYAAVLNNFAEIEFKENNHLKAKELYLQAAEIIIENYGKDSLAFKSIQKNIDYIDKFIYKENTKDDKLLDLSRKLSKKVECFIKINFKDLYPKICLALVGKGSECYGFDDDISSDHDYGNRLLILLPDYEYIEYSKKLMYELSKNFKEKFEIYRIKDFYKFYTSFDEGPKSIEEFRKVSEEYLSVVTNGEVFLDNLGEFSKIRKRLLAHYDKDLSLKYMALYLNKMAQAGQYNFSRCLKRNDIVGANFALTEFIENYIYFVHIINKKYTPFYKWRFKSCKSLNILGEYSCEILQNLLNERLEKKSEIIEDICKKVVIYLNEVKLSNSQIDFLTYQARELIEKIDDTELKKIDSFVR